MLTELIIILALCIKCTLLSTSALILLFCCLIIYIIENQYAWIRFSFSLKEGDTTSVFVSLNHLHSIIHMVPDPLFLFYKPISSRWVMRSYTATRNHVSQYFVSMVHVLGRVDLWAEHCQVKAWVLGTAAKALDQKGGLDEKFVNRFMKILIMSGPHSSIRPLNHSLIQSPLQR